MILTMDFSALNQHLYAVCYMAVQMLSPESGWCFWIKTKQQY